MDEALVGLIVVKYNKALEAAGLGNVDCRYVRAQRLEHLLKKGGNEDIRFYTDQFIGPRSLHPLGTLHSGQGRMLLHLFANIETTVIQSELERVSGWKRDSDQVSSGINRLANQINGNSRQLRIQYIWGVDCRLYRRTN